MVAALTLGVAPPTQAGNIYTTCAQVTAFCAGAPSQDASDFCMLVVSGQNQLNCGTCQFVNGACDYISQGPAQAEACKAELNNEFNCPTDCGDSRVNTNCSAPEIVYCNGDNADFYAYNFDTLKGDFDFSIPLADLQMSVAEKTLVKQVGTVKVYLMPDGRVLLVARQPDGKDYFMFWDPSNCASLQESAEWNVQ